MASIEEINTVLEKLVAPRDPDDVKKLRSVMLRLSYFRDKTFSAKEAAFNTYARNDLHFYLWAMYADPRDYDVLHGFGTKYKFVPYERDPLMRTYLECNRILDQCLDDYFFSDICDKCDERMCSCSAIAKLAN